MRQYNKPTILALSLLLAGCAHQPSMMEMDQWDLVWISDSSGWGVAEVFAEMIEEDTGIKVNVHDNWVGGLAAGDVLAAIQGTPTPSMTLRQNADLIREAEIVVFYGNPQASGYDQRDWLCTSSEQANYVNSCEMDSFSAYIEDLQAVYEEILELRGDKPVIIRTFDAYNPLINELKEQGVYQECMDCWGKYNNAIRQAAEAYNIPVAEVAEAWNGPGWDQDPSDLGFTRDGIHPNERGARAIAHALRELGYEPVNP